MAVDISVVLSRTICIEPVIWQSAHRPDRLIVSEERGIMSSHRLAGNEESDEHEEPPELGRMTELIAKELNESVSAIVINADTCLRMFASDHPNVEGARETARRTIRDCNRAAEAVSWLSTLAAARWPLDRSP